MTEREKRIKEMVGIAHPIYGANYLDIIALGRLVDAGYRKADEVRKETATAILSAWKQISRSYDSGETQKKSFERIARLAEWYGVEVE